MAFPFRRLPRATVVHQAVTGPVAMRPHTYLTPRELDVLAFLVMGKTNREIAASLNLGQSTVKSHLSSIYEKLGVSNRTQAAMTGLRLFPILPDLAGQAASRLREVGLVAAPRLPQNAHRERDRR